MLFIEVIKLKYRQMCFFYQHISTLLTTFLFFLFFLAWIFDLPLCVEGF